MGDLMSTVKANDLQTTTGGIPTVKGQKLIPTAWVNFNGVGTIVIRDSANVSSITDYGVGNYAANFATAMSNTNYCAITYNNGHSTSTSSGAFNNQYGGGVWNNSTTACDISSYNTGLIDSTYFTLIVMGGQA